jgi:glucose 1-dehydrogenase
MQLTMKAMSVIPGRPGSELIAGLPDPPPADGSVLVEGLLAGIELVPELAGRLAQAGVLCLIGISSSQRRLPVDLNRVAASMVLENAVIFGTVSAARRHYEQAVEALTRADPAWLGGLITRRVPLSSWQEVLTRQPGDVKVTVDLTK